MNHIFYFTICSLLLHFFATQTCYSQEWVEIENLPAKVHLKMPSEIKQNKETVFVQNRPTIMTIYESVDVISDNQHYFTWLKIEGEISKKRKKKILQEALVLSSVRHVAKAFNQEKVFLGDQQEGIQAELLTSSNEYIKLKCFIVDQYLLTIYVVAANGQNQSLIDEYLNGLFIRETSNELIANKTKVAESRHMEWEEVVFDKFKLSFPIAPFEQKQIIINGENQEAFVYHYANDQYNNIVYLIGVLESMNDWKIDQACSKAIYTLEEQLSAKVMDRKDIEFLRFPAREFILQKRKNYYRVRYYFIENKLYQLVVQSNFHNINSFQIEQFYDSFTLID